MRQLLTILSKLYQKIIIILSKNYEKGDQNKGVSLFWQDF